MLYELIYSSLPETPFSEDDIGLLLTEARARNADLDITGVLFFNGREFFQLLEGERDVVNRIFTSIERDARHREITVFHAGPIERRAFAEWSMAYERVEAGTSFGNWKDDLAVSADDQALHSPSLGYRLFRLLRDQPSPRYAVG
ncbi:MAG: BLUF domain-containing protein [Hyphomicrobiaceae bacterium]|nr:BLUF domain-containing protein [Hyphomicrobiaceae bacterium]